jgi:hypothetical protein
MTLKALAKAIRADAPYQLEADTEDLEVVLDTCTCPECSYQLEPDEINRLVAAATDLAHFDRLVVEALRDHRVNDCV